MENRYWRWIGILLVFLVGFGFGYSYGFVNGGNQTFDFFMGFVAYSVDNGIISIDIDSDKLRNYIELAEKYCFRNNQGSGGLIIDCGGN